MPTTDRADISEDEVERGAKALWEFETHGTHDDLPWDAINDGIKDRYRAGMRVALQSTDQYKAGAEAMREAAAKVCDDEKTACLRIKKTADRNNDPKFATAMAKTALHSAQLAAAIRAMPIPERK